MQSRQKWSRGAVLFVLGVALAGAGCSREPEVREKVTQSLEQARITNVEVAYDDDANLVHLRGTVDSIATRQQAEQIATATVGTSGRVLNELTVQGLNEQHAGALDDGIRDTLDEMVENDPILKERDIEFEVRNGVVTVKGEVQSAAEKSRLTELLQSAPGVKDFANAVEIEQTQ